MNKKKQRKWVRYERKYSMSLWQGGWKRLGEKWMIAFMDDASRTVFLIQLPQKIQSKF